MSKDRPTAEGLEDITGVKVSQIRRWTQAGILPRPGAGRYASYPEGTEALVLKARDLYLKGLGVDAIKLAMEASEPKGNAGDYLASLRRNGAFGGGTPGFPDASPPDAPALPGVSHLVRIEVTPTVHIVAEGPLDDRALETLRLAAEAARRTLLSPER